MSRKKKKCRGEQKNCFNCDHFLYVGEGDHICDIDNSLLTDDWVPTDDFYKCKGKRYAE